MNKKRYMGLDLGSKTCGIAVSDELGLFAHPVVTLTVFREDYDELLQQLEPLVKQYDIAGFALGFPKMMNNDIGERAQLSIVFKEMLENRFNLEVELIDERLTSAISHRKLIALDKSRKKRKKVIDQAAAVEILQTWLDKKRR